MNTCKHKNNPKSPEMSFTRNGRATSVTVQLSENSNKTVLPNDFVKLFDVVKEDKTEGK